MSRRACACPCVHTFVWSVYVYLGALRLCCYRHPGLLHGPPVCSTFPTTEIVGHLPASPATTSPLATCHFCPAFSRASGRRAASAQHAAPCLTMCPPATSTLQKGDGRGVRCLKYITTSSWLFGSECQNSREGTFPLDLKDGVWISRFLGKAGFQG